MVLPAVRDLSIYQGDTFYLDIRLRQKTVDGAPGLPVDLTGCSIQAQIRTTVDDPAIMATMTGVQGDGLGTVTLSLTSSQTRLLTNGVYDMSVTFPDGTIRTFLKGVVLVQRDVTR